MKIHPRFELGSLELSLPVTFGIILFLLAMGGIPILDPDFYWHLKTGQVILENREIPEIEIFSSTAAGTPWIVQGWLFELQLALLWQFTGEWGARTFTALMIMITWTLVYCSVRMYVERKELALLISAPSILFFLTAAAPRYTMITLAGVALTTYLVLRFKNTACIRSLYPFPIIFALWPNYHFGFIVGLLLITLFMTSEFIDKILPLKKTVDEKGKFLSTKPIFIFILTLLATGLNPYFFSIYLEIARAYFLVTSAQIAEWQSISLDSFAGKIGFVLLGVFITSLFLTRQRRSWSDLIVPLIFLWAGFSASRNVAVMGAVVLPFIARQLFINGQLTVATDRLVNKESQRTQNEISKAVTMAINSMLILIALALSTFSYKYGTPMAHTIRGALYPEGAVNFIIQENLQGNIFNTYNSGGYLLYRLHPTRKVFIDPRYHVYPIKIIEDYFNIHNLNDNWEKTLDKYKPNIFIIESESLLRTFLLMRPDLRLVYEDQYFSILVTDTPPYQHLHRLEVKHGNRGIATESR